MGQLALKFLATHWKTSAVVALILTVGGGCAALWVQRDHALIAKGAAEERARVADSTLKVITPRLARVDTLLVHDTVKVRLAVDRVVTIRDTVLHHLTDTLLVKEYVARTDTALHACSELLGDCATFRALATQKISALEAKLAAQPAAMAPRSCTVSNVVWGVLGAGGGYFIGRR